MGRTIYGLFKNSDKSEQEGIVVDYGEAGKFRIARAGGSNRKYARRLEQISKPHRAAIRSEVLPDELANKLLIQVFAETIVLGWEGVLAEDGSPLPFSVPNCVKLFEDLPDLFQDLREQANKGALFRQALLEADSGN